MSKRTAPVDPVEVVRLADVNQPQDDAPDTSREGDSEALWDAVRTLPPQQRDAILYVYGEQLSHAQTASVLGCSEKTVSWHIHEAKKRLKILLKAVS